MAIFVLIFVLISLLYNVFIIKKLHMPWFEYEQNYYISYLYNAIYSKYSIRTMQLHSVEWWNTVKNGILMRISIKSKNRWNRINTKRTDQRSLTACYKMQFLAGIVKAVNRTRHVFRSFWVYDQNLKMKRGKVRKSGFEKKFNTYQKLQNTGPSSPFCCP